MRRPQVQATPATIGTRHRRAVLLHLSEALSIEMPLQSGQDALEGLSVTPPDPNFFVLGRPVETKVNFLITRPL
ncbi:MAG: hypothetical protein VX916_03855, partial [Planctomycetota bacterium]|nr:hypothetical protein [Planctomycetota bacterium]